MSDSKSEFEKLSRDLDDDERKLILNKIKKDKNQDDDQDTIDNDSINIHDKIVSIYEKQLRIAKNIYDKENLLSKIVIWLISVFSGKKKEEVILSKLFNDIKKEITLINNAIIDFESETLTSYFVSEIINLSDSCNIVVPVIDKFFNDTQFYNSFLAYSLEKTFSNELKMYLNNLNPETFESDPSKPDKENFLNEKKKRLNTFFNHLSMISDREFNKKFLNFEIIIRLITFDFKTIIYYFSQDNPPGQPLVKFGVKFNVIELLFEKLYSLLNTINFTYDDINFIEDMVEYSHFKQSEKEFNELFFTEIDINNIKIIFKSVDDFIDKIPVLKIFQYFTKNILYKPPPLNLKFSFLNTYKTFKRNKVDSEWEIYFEKLKSINQNKLIKELLNDYNFNTLDFFNEKFISEINKYSHIKIKSVKKMNFLVQFIDQVYKKEVEKIINKVLIDGSFTKENYRNNLSSAYYILYNSRERIKLFDKKLDPNEDLGKKITNYLKYTSNEIDFAKSLQNSVISINETSDELINDLLAALYFIGDFINNLYNHPKGDNIVVIDFDNIKMPGYMNSYQALNKIKRYFDLFFKIFKGLEDF